MKSLHANIWVKTFFLVAEKCMQYYLALAVWGNPPTKCELASVNFEACWSNNSLHVFEITQNMLNFGLRCNSALKANCNMDVEWFLFHKQLVLRKSSQNALKTDHLAWWSNKTQSSFQSVLVVHACLSR